MKQIALLLILTLFLTTPAALAKEGKGGKGKSGEAKVEVKIKNEQDPLQAVQKVEIEENKFEIRGQISAVSGNNFVVAGQTIFIDPSQVREFEQKGIVNVGDNVKVEGVIKNGVKFAREIKVIGEGQGRFKFEIKGLPSLLPTVSPSVSPIGSPSATPQATTSANVKVKIKANGPVDQVVTFLQQILNFLQNLI